MGCTHRRAWRWAGYAVTAAVNGPVSRRVFDDKDATRTFLRERGFPTASRLDCASTHPSTRMVVKPRTGKHGAGVRIGLHKHVKGATVTDTCESYIPGNHFRVIMWRGQVAGIVQRTGARVLGDGVHTRGELMARHNRTRCPGTHARSDRSATAVLPKGASIHHDLVCNYARGGTVSRVPLDSVHADTVTMMRQLAVHVPARLYGVDLIIQDIRQSHAGQAVAVNELELFPDVDIHHSLGDEVMTLFRWLLVVVLLAGLLLVGLSGVCGVALYHSLSKVVSHS